ncbi:hypothetical protein P8918_13725 [Bacillus spizizenii]|nr:hypothetical protein [Bacillus spizizenii]MCY8890364.1 hypothetical protein [Bacillus spizizenii]MEC0842088.1 hypothetical protein [Bacillus spizizenii]
MPAGIPSRASAPIYDITRRARKREPVNKEHNDSMSWSASEASATNKPHRHLFDQVKEVITKFTKTGNRFPLLDILMEKTGNRFPLWTSRTETSPDERYYL